MRARAWYSHYGTHMQHTPRTFIFAGRSGCGKGTQLKLLREKLAASDPSRPITASVTGDMFRAFFSEHSYTSERAQALTAAGKLQPLFLTIWLWAKGFVESYDPEAHLFIDGYPRRAEESVAVDSLLSFYGRENIVVLNFNVSRESSKARMLSRGRDDDTPENAETRLDWYDTEVAPAIEWFRNRPGYVFLDIDGERSIEEIHQDISNQIGL